MDVKFYIFGVPDGFDLYQGNAEDTSFLQTYYDGSNENAKLTIQRRGTQVYYSYLRYNLISVASRAGSFFGMSVMLNNKYCDDVPKLYRFFEAVYEKTILKNEILLKATSNGQVMFVVQTLKDAENEILNVESIVRKNLANQFAGGFKSLDNSFKQNENQNVLVKLNYPEVTNNAINYALREYAIISISSDYIVKDDDGSGDKDTGTKVEVISSENLLKIMQTAQNVNVDINTLSKNWQNINTLFNALNLANAQKQVEIKTEIMQKCSTLSSEIDIRIANIGNIPENTQQYLQNQPNHPSLIACKKMFDELVNLKNEVRIIMLTADASDKKTPDVKKRKDI